jgi:hypothetical protein
MHALQQPEPGDSESDPCTNEAARVMPMTDPEVERDLGLLDSLDDGDDEDAREQRDSFAFLRWGLARQYLREAYEAGLGDHLTALGPATEEEIQRSLALLDSLLEGDEAEQRETGAYVARAVAERRASVGSAR